MKTIVGKAKIVQRGFNMSVHCYLSSEFRRLLNCEFIIFDINNLVIRRAGIDNKKLYSVKSSLFGFTPKADAIEGVIGDYNIKQQDEDTFILKKVKYHA